MIAKGVIVAEGPPAKIGGRDTAQTVIRFRVDDREDLPSLGHVPLGDGTLELRTEHPTKVLHELTAWALDRGSDLEGLEVRRPTLEDIYLQLTGGEAGAE